MNAYPFFQDARMNDAFSSFSPTSYGTIPFGFGDMGATWNPLDASSNPGMMGAEDPNEPSLFMTNDGEAVKRDLALSRFPDGSHNSMLLQGALCFQCGNRPDTNRQDPSDSPTHVLGTLGWVNTFSEMQHRMAIKNLHGIVMMVANKLANKIDPPNKGNGPRGGNFGGDVLDLIVTDDNQGNTGNYVSKFTFRKTNTTSKNTQTTVYGTSARDMKELSLAITDAVGSGQSQFFNEVALLLWVDFAKKVGNQNVLSDMLTLDMKRDENKYLYGQSFATMGYSEKYDNNSDGSALQKRPDILNEWFIKGSSINVKHKVAFSDKQKTPVAVNRYVTSAKDNKFFFGEDNNPLYWKMLKLSNNPTEKDILKHVAEFDTLLKVCNLELLQIYAKSFNMPKESAFNTSSTTALPYLLAKQHLNLFKLHGCVEALEENAESRSIYGQPFSSGPKCLVVTRRRVETRNLWGSVLKEGQPLYIIHTRRFGKEVESGAWFNNTISQVPTPARASRGYYDPSAYVTGKYDPFKHDHDLDDSAERLSKQKKSVSTLIIPNFLDQVAVVKKDKSSKNMKVTEPSDLKIDASSNANRSARYRYTKEAWERLDVVEKLRISWEDYGSWAWLPATNVNLEDLRRTYGYPDILGHWNDPEIEFIGTTMFEENFPHYPIQSLFKTVSGYDVIGGSGDDKNWQYKRLGNYELVSAQSKLPNIAISMRK